MKSFKILAFTAFFIAAFAVLSSSTYRIISQSLDKDIASSSEEIQILDASIYDIGNRIPIATPEPILPDASELQKATKDKLKLYPNPVDDKLTIEIKDKNVNFTLFNLNGKLILSNQLKSTVNTIDVSAINSGIYFYEVSNTKGIKLVKGKLIVTK